jgi:hypothetical protein
MHLDSSYQFLSIILVISQIYQIYLDIKRDRHINECEKVLRKISGTIHSGSN